MKVYDDIKLNVIASVSATGDIGIYDISDESKVRVVVENADVGNTVVVSGRIKGQIGFATIKTFTGTVNDTLNVSTYDQIKIECTVFESMDSNPIRVLAASFNGAGGSTIETIGVPSGSDLTDVEQLTFTSSDGSVVITGDNVTKEIDFTVNPAVGAVTSVNTQTGDVVLTKSDIGLGNVDNTSDLNKPISTATKAFFDANTYYHELHVNYDYTGGGSDGSPYKPFTTTQAAINAAQLQNVGGNTAILIHLKKDIIINESLVVNNAVSNLYITTAVPNNVDSSPLKFIGSLTISGSQTNRVRVKDLNFSPTSGYALIIDDTNGRHMFQNCQFTNGGNIGLAGTGVTLINTYKNFIEFIDCSVEGVFNIDGTPSANTLVSLYRCRLAYANVIVNSPNVIVSMYDTYGINGLTHTSGALAITGSWGINSFFNSTANLSATNVLSMSNVSFQKPDFSFVAINKTGTCPYQLMNVHRGETSDVLTGSRIVYGPTATDAGYKMGVSGNWSPAVSNVAGALDQLAANKISSSQKGAANGVAPLNGSSKIDATYLPAYVDDVLEFANLAAFPVTGSTGILYLALDTNKIYRWSGSTYVEVSQGITDHTLLSNIGTNTHANIDTHIASTANPHSVTKAQVGLGNVDNTSDINKPISTATQNALNLKVDKAGDTMTGSLNMSALSENVQFSVYGLNATSTIDIRTDDDATRPTGDVRLETGDASGSDYAGSIYLNGGSNVNGNPANIQLTAGQSTGTGANGSIILDAKNVVYLNQNASGSIQASNHRIEDVADPTADQDAATKKWVEDISAVTNTLIVDASAPIFGADGSLFRPFNTIADALAVAVDGTIIIILPGTYSEPTVVIPSTLKSLVLLGTSQSATTVSNGFSYTAPADNIDVLFEKLNIGQLTFDASSALSGLVNIKQSVVSYNRVDNNMNVFMITTESNVFGGTIAGGGNNFSEVLIIISPEISNGLLIVENSKFVQRIEVIGLDPVTVRTLDCELFGSSAFVHGNGSNTTWETDASTDALGTSSGVTKVLLANIPLSNITQSGAISGQVPTWDGTAWVASTPTPGITDHTLLSNIGTNTHADIDTHIADTSNPHAVTAAQVGLGNVDNTSDLDKPISTATQTALDDKVAKAGDTMTGDLNFDFSAGPVTSTIAITNDDILMTFQDPSGPTDFSTELNSGGVVVQDNVTGANTSVNGGSIFLYDDLMATAHIPVADGEVTTKKYVDDQDALKADVGHTHDLSAINHSGAITGQVPTWNGTNWVPDTPITDHTLLSNIGTNSHADIDTHIASTSNPHSVTAAQVGLGNVDNTSDLDKPISTATQTALNGKANSSHTHSLNDLTQTGATSGQIPSWNGTNWVPTTVSTSATWGSITGTLSTQTDLQSALDGKFDDPIGTTSQYIRGDGSLATFPTVINQSNALVTTVFNKTGSPIPKFSVVYIDGGQGDLPTIQLAQGNTEATSSKTYGVVEADIPNMQSGQVIVSGALTGLDTDQFNPTAPTGDVNGVALWLSPTTAGAVTTTKPSAPNHMVYVATIVRTHQTQGVIEVRVQNGFELQELHNVALSSPPLNNQVLKYETSTSLWKNKYIGSQGDIEETNFFLTNNQSSATNITGFAFSNSVVRSFSALVSIYINATSSLYEQVTIEGIQKGSSWDISVSGVGDSSGISFSITAAGQLQYISTNVSGYISGTMKFRAITTSV